MLVSFTPLQRFVERIDQLGLLFSCSAPAPGCPSDQKIARIGMVKLLGFNAPFAVSDSLGTTFRQLLPKMVSLLDDLQGTFIHENHAESADQVMVSLR